MKIFVLVATLCGASALGAEKTPDLTGQDVAAFKAHEGQVVALHGKLRKPSGTSAPATLIGLGGKGVIFHLADLTPPEGRPSWPKAWADLVGQRVLVTGKLHFVPANQPVPHENSPGHFYMEPSQAKIEPLKELHR